MTIRKKICCTTYKNICTYQKKVIPLQHEKVNKIYDILCGCMASCSNSHIINLLHSRKFADVNLTQSKLAKSLHLKIGAKIIKKTNINKLNYKKMFYVWLNGKNLRRFKNLQKAKLFAIKYLTEKKLNNEKDEFVISNPCDYNFETIDVFLLKHIF